MLRRDPNLDVKSEMDRTTWQYDQASGLLTNKLYADGKGTSYTYTPDGKLATRAWARLNPGTGLPLQTLYTYDSIGQMTNINYSDSTPDVSLAFDRLGRQTTITDGQGTRTFTYNDALQLDSELLVMGSGNYSLTRSYDTYGRSAGFDIGDNYSVNYSYDPVGRFSSLTSQVSGPSPQSFSYSYLPGYDLISEISNLQSDIHAQREYEPNRNLITEILNTSGTNVISKFDYQNDALGRRTKRVDASSLNSSSLTNAFGYNARSELIQALMSTNSHRYGYDPIGNRRTATNNMEALAYAANALNQYTNIVDGVVITPKYDFDGNLTNCGAIAYAWDAENRLVSISSNGQWVASFSYDYMSRRIGKATPAVTNTFTYDGWAMIQEVRLTSNASPITNSYVYGLDLSGTLQGAGTIGGLLASYTSESPNAVRLYCYDANGNVSDLVDGNGSSIAHYEYDPYGNTSLMTGTSAIANPYRFSTKYIDDETGLYYYGHRFYSPGMGRWVSRDPIGIRGGRNLYAFCNNRIADSVDPRGLTANTCSAVSGRLNGTLDVATISHEVSSPSYYLAHVTVVVIIVGPGRDGSGEDSPISPPGGFDAGLQWLGMHSHVKNGVTCKMKNLCKGTCKNPCCSWEIKWEKDHVYGTVSSTLRDATAPEDAPPWAYDDATCDPSSADMAAGLQLCKNSPGDCNQ